MNEGANLLGKDGIWYEYPYIKDAIRFVKTMLRTEPQHINFYHYGTNKITRFWNCETGWGR